MRGLPDVGAAVLPIALSMAVVAVAQVRDARRRTALNRALHELRRPLQALVLQGRRSTGGPLDLAVVALADLDRAINGGRSQLRLRPTPVRGLVAGAVARSRPLAIGQALQVSYGAGGAQVLVDPVRIAQALDNLIANALEHGTGLVRIRTSVSARGARIEVEDRGSAAHSGPSRKRDPRRGHGLRVAAQAAAAHGGRMLVSRSAARTVAAIELPLALA